MAGKASKMYKDSPALERDQKGDLKVGKSNKLLTDADADQTGTDGVKMEEAMPMAARHMMERHAMHSQHETEHSIHDHGKAGDKMEMHERHRKAMHDMHKRHEKEMKKGTSTEGGAEKAPKEKAEKEMVAPKGKDVDTKSMGGGKEKMKEKE